MAQGQDRLAEIKGACRGAFDSVSGLKDCAVEAPKSAVEQVIDYIADKAVELVTENLPGTSHAASALRNHGQNIDDAVNGITRPINSGGGFTP